MNAFIPGAHRFRAESVGPKSLWGKPRWINHQSIAVNFHGINGNKPRKPWVSILSILSHGRPWRLDDAKGYPYLRNTICIYIHIMCIYIYIWKIDETRIEVTTIKDCMTYHVLPRLRDDHRWLSIHWVYNIYTLCLDSYRMYTMKVSHV